MKQTMTTADRIKASQSYTAIARLGEENPENARGYFVAKLSNGRAAGTVAGPFKTAQEAWSEIDRLYMASREVAGAALAE